LTSVGPWLPDAERNAVQRAVAEAIGRVVQVDPIKPASKATGTERLKLRYDELLSNVAFNFKLRRYPSGAGTSPPAKCAACCRLLPPKQQQTLSKLADKLWRRRMNLYK
jgi:hypothetical protein